jgi:SAM-dependent methyltransferase
VSKRKGKARASTGQFTQRQLPPSSTTADAELLAALALLRQRRAPYTELFKEIVAETLERFPLPPDQAIVEIGSGTGQLREWLPAGVRERMVHTDPSDPALRALRQRAPDAKTRVASAEGLPVDDGTCGGVLGLCVFDAVKNPSRVLAEIARVLCPRGRFVHVMDMATLLEAPFEKLSESGLVPLPNVFGDPGDHEWPLDIVLVQRDWLAGLLSLTARAAHPLSSTFGGYFAAFLSRPFDVNKATPLFKTVASSAQHRSRLMVLFESAGRLAFEQGYPPIQPLPFHSARYLQSLMETSFRESDAFRVERSAIITRSMWRPVAVPPERLVRYQSLCLGHQRLLDTFPERLMTESARDELIRGVPHDKMLIEAGAFVFVASRV